MLAPGLTAAGIETCLGSNSVGGAGPGFGVTIAGTITDRGCNLRLYSRTLYSMGHKLAATQILCNDPDVAAALALEGVRCLVGPAAEAAARGLANARAEAEAPPVAGSVARAPCRNWVLFRGCLDEPEPEAAGMTAAPVLDPPRGRTKLTTAEIARSPDSAPALQPFIDQRSSKGIGCAVRCRCKSLTSRRAENFARVSMPFERHQRSYRHVHRAQFGGAAEDPAGR